MLCPDCKIETKVVDSRRRDLGVWRRRECPTCEDRFNTFESFVYKTKAKKREKPAPKPKIEKPQKPKKLKPQQVSKKPFNPFADVRKEYNIDLDDDY